MKTKRGQKKCAGCGTINGARSFVCKQCGSEFHMKKFKKGHRKILIKDHTTLQAGDTIRVIGGSGPYYEHEDGERTYFVDRGKYNVVKTEPDGICVYGENGYEYLYMGKICKSTILDSIIKAPCKILLIRKPSHAN